MPANLIKKSINSNEEYKENVVKNNLLKILEKKTFVHEEYLILVLILNNLI